MFIKYELSASSVMRALGYPRRMLLATWIKEQLPFDCQSDKRRKPRVEYTHEQKIDAIVSLASGEKRPIDLEVELGVTKSTISQWKHQLLKEGEPYAMKRNTIDPQSDRKTYLEEQCSDLKTELNMLQRQVTKLQMEKDILEKAASVLKKREGIDIKNLTNKEKAMVVDVLHGSYSIKSLLASVHLAKSSYFYQKNAMNYDKYADLRNCMNIELK